ncbi:MAG: transporter substrate-binding domain-containing protein [Pseudomonadota bacterium]
MTIRRIAWACAGLSAFMLIFGQVRAETLTVAVEDKNYVPYYLWVEGQPSGLCVEVAEGAIRLMGDEVEFLRRSWVRVLRDVERKVVDAGLCGTKNQERAAYSHYPEEPLTTYDATLFVSADSSLVSSDIDDLDGRRFGLVKGYNYGELDKDMEEKGMIRIEAPDRETLFKLLIKGRLDVMLDSVMPTLADARKLGYQTKIRPLFPSLSESPGYLFFSQKPGHDELAKKFSEALKEFKQTEEYATIKARYGL